MFWQYLGKLLQDYISEIRIFFVNDNFFDNKQSQLGFLSQVN